MKVLVISRMFPNATDPIQGIFVLRQVRELLKKHEIKVIAPVPWVPKALRWLSKKGRNYASVRQRDRIEGIEVYYPRYLWGLRRRSLASLSLTLCLSRILGCLRWKSDVAHLHGVGALSEGLGAVLIRRYLNVPLILTVHGHDPFLDAAHQPFHRWMIRFTFARVDRVIAVGPKLAELIAPFVNDRKKIRIIGNGIRVSEIPKKETHKETLYPGQKIVLTVGFLTRPKGVDFLLRALPGVCAEVPETRCLIIGEGPEQCRLVRLAEDLDLQDRVFFMGRRPHDEVYRYMSLCDLFVLPSWRESFGIVYLEAMSVGKPVIGCWGQGIEGIIRDGEEGLLVRPKDVSSLQEAMLRLLKDEELSTEMGRKGRQLVLEQYTWEQKAREIEGVYEELTRIPDMDA